MSEGDDAGRLAAELARLLAEARALGVGDALRPLLEEFLSTSTSLDAGVTPPLPGRFGMVGESAGMREVFALVERVAPSDVPVLVLGETGTGKELVARALHEHSRRRGGPFLAENCAAIPENLLESELFGHVKGAFTGAVANRDGHFAAAHGGTLFLDEIGDLPLGLQSKLLRVLERGEVRPVGAEDTRAVDVRVVAATHQDLTARVAERAFREDLLFRLDVVRIELPALRHRGEDVHHLAHHFLAVERARIGRADVELSPGALEALAAAPWPGNVRQLENEIRRAVALSEGKILRSDLSPGIAGEGRGS